MLKDIKKIGFLASLIFVTASANASIVTISDWFIDGVDDGSSDFRVTEIFTTAAELGGTDNRYQYSFENLTLNLSANLFRIGNPTSAGRTSMTGPSSWAERGSVNFIWETSVVVDYVGPSESLFGLTLLTPDVLPALTTPPLNIASAGWIQASNSSGTRFNIF